MSGERRTCILALLFSWVVCVTIIALFFVRTEFQKDIIESLVAQLKNATGYPHRVASSEDPNSERSQFTFSPDKTYIAFIQDVFEEYGEDGDRYWALKIFDPARREERVLLVDDTHLSGYEWLDAKILRVFHDAGTGVRVFRDVSVTSSPIFFKDAKYTERHSKFWTPDAAYAREAVDAQEAWRAYNESIGK